MPVPAELPHATIIAARGPFRTEDDANLFRAYDVARVLAKNSGGNAAYAKIEAARRLGLPVHMVRRPRTGERPLVASVEEAMAAIAAHITAHHAPRIERGV